MFARLGRLVAHGWVGWLFAWIVLVACLRFFAPPLTSVTRPGEFDFLPPDVPSRKGAEVFQSAFPGAGSGSSVVLVVSRDAEKLRPADRQFVESVLAPRLESLQEADKNEGPAAAKSAATRAPERPIVARLRTASEKGMGPLLDSGDGKATLVVLELRTDFLSFRAVPLVTRIDEVVEDLRKQHLVPAGLNIAETGSAVVGRDMGLAKQRSAQQTSFWTIVLIIVLLVFVYRAPLLTLVPLLTLYVGFNVFLGLLTASARATGVGLFEGIDVYSMVLAYGVGVDYTLFLIARYREELSAGADLPAATVTTLSKVGSAVAASAATGIFGIGMMAFASFGKLHQAGLSIALSLLVMLCGALTLTPSLLRLGGRWIFWPRVPRKADAAETQRPEGAVRTATVANGGRQAIGLFDALWRYAGEAVLRRPATLWIVAFVLLAPFAAVALYCYNRLDYGLITDLPRQAPSVVGTDAIRAHFPAGDTGPLTVLIQDPKVDFSDPDAIEFVGTLCERLMSQKDALDIADIRSVANPLGMTPRAEQYLTSGIPNGIAGRAELRERAIQHYVGQGTGGTHVVRLDLVLSIDPFSRQSIQVLDRLETAIRQALPGQLAGHAEIYPIGPTASIRDLKVVADHDRLLINGLVIAVVLAVLLLLRLGIGLSLYLVATVVFSYLASLGVTFCLFWALNPRQFPGLAWTVPLFLFVVLVAVGIDYNIFLLSRVREESARLGPVRGVGEALARTGSIISSCGIIMAGTFSSLLLGGHLAEMTQLGFALTFGILLDTFVVRPLLVPSFLVLVQSGRLSPLASKLSSAPRPQISAR